VYFGKRPDTLPFSSGDYVDIVFTPEINNFLGENVQLHIKDARPCEETLIEIESALECIADAEMGKRRDDVRISYEELGKIWRMLTKRDFTHDAPIAEIKRRASSETGDKNLSKLLVAFKIFSEVGLMNCEYENYRVRINIAEHNNKVDLEDSATYRLYKSSGSR